MPGIRLLARSSVVAAFIVAAAVAFVAIRNVFACPASPPPTLRTLVLKSDRVVVATVGESLVIETQEFEHGYNYALKRTLLHVSATAKGDTHESTVYVHHQVWGEGTPQEYGNLKRDKPLLLFLNQRQEGDGYELINIMYGVKELPDADMKIYLRRIEELAAIMRQKKPDTREVVEWLVRCAEEPATRWDGAVELAMSAAMQTADEQEAAAAAAPRANTAPSVDSKETDEDSASDGDSADDSGEEAVAIISYFADADVDATFAAQLTGEHKDRLAAALLNLQEVGDQEMPLVGLFVSWKDARLTPFLIAHLRKLADNPPYLAEELVMAVAHILDDKTLIDLANDYIKRTSYDDETAADQAVAESDGAEPEATVTAEAGVVESGESEDGQMSTGTNRQQRSEMLRRFIARVENQASPEAASLETRVK